MKRCIRARRTSRRRRTQGETNYINELKDLEDEKWIYDRD